MPRKLRAEYPGAIYHVMNRGDGGWLVAGMRWLLSSYTLRLNYRRKLFGHVFSGRYKALLVDGSNNGHSRCKRVR